MPSTSSTNEKAKATSLSIPQESERVAKIPYRWTTSNEYDRTHPAGCTRAYRHRKIESCAAGGFCGKSAADGKVQTVKAVLRDSIQRGPIARVRAAGDRALCQFPSPSDTAVRPFS